MSGSRVPVGPDAHRRSPATMRSSPPATTRALLLATTDQPRPSQPAKLSLDRQPEFLRQFFALIRLPDDL